MFARVIADEAQKGTAFVGHEPVGVEGAAQELDCLLHVGDAGLSEAALVEV